MRGQGPLRGKAFQERNEVPKMDGQKLVPQIVARSEKMREQIHTFRLSKEGQDVLGKVLFSHLVDELIEMAHRLCRVGSLRQVASKLFEHCNCHLQPLLLSRILNFPTPGISDEKMISGLGVDVADCDPV